MAHILFKSGANGILRRFVSAQISRLFDEMVVN